MVMQRQQAGLSKSSFHPVTIAMPLHICRVGCTEVEQTLTVSAVVIELAQFGFRATLHLSPKSLRL